VTGSLPARPSQIRWLAKADIISQVRFIERTFDVTFDYRSRRTAVLECDVFRCWKSDRGRVTGDPETIAGSVLINRMRKFALTRGTLSVYEDETDLISEETRFVPAHGWHRYW